MITILTCIELICWGVVAIGLLQQMKLARRQMRLAAERHTAYVDMAERVGHFAELNVLQRAAYEYKLGNTDPLMQYLAYHCAGSSFDEAMDYANQRVEVLKSTLCDFPKSVVKQAEDILAMYEAGLITKATATAMMKAA